MSIILGSTNNTIGGTTAADRNIISANTVDGIQIRNAGTASNVVLGNYIGLDVTGTVDLGNTNQGVAIFGSATNNTIGGTAAGARNVLSGNNGEGVRITGAGTTGNVVQGNFIGTNAAGTAGIANSRQGVWIDNAAANNTIGGTAAGAGNTIAYNTLDGVALSSIAGTGNAVLGNAIFSNGGLGIDLLDDNVTGNDGAKTAGQPNLLMDFPVVQTASLNGTTLTLARLHRHCIRRHRFRRGTGRVLQERGRCWDERGRSGLPRLPDGQCERQLQRHAHRERPGARRPRYRNGHGRFQQYLGVRRECHGGGHSPGGHQ